MAIVESISFGIFVVGTLLFGAAYRPILFLLFAFGLLSFFPSPSSVFAVVVGVVLFIITGVYDGKV